MPDEVLDPAYNLTFLPELMTAIQVARCDGRMLDRKCNAPVVVREGARYFCPIHASSVIG